MAETPEEKAEREANERAAAKQRAADLEAALERQQEMARKAAAEKLERERQQGDK